MYSLGSIGRTRLYVDVGFLILIAFFVAMNYDPQRGIQYALLWAPVVFVSVLLHELAHALLIAVFGYGASHVILGGMGGVTINKRRAKPWHEVLISIAGPLTSFAIAWVAATAAERLPQVGHDPMLAALIPYLYYANIFWGKFNLVPVRPLDGGHAVHNFLRIFLDERRAFAGAVWIGMIGGTAAAAYAAYTGAIFIAMFLGWMVFENFRQWQAFRGGGPVE